MHESFKMAIPSKVVLAPTIPYVVAFTSLAGVKSVAEVGSGGRRWRSEAAVGGRGR